MGMRKYLATLAVGLAGLMPIGQVSADHHMEDVSGWNGSVGGGVMMYEGDEEVEHTQIYQIVAGYDFNNRWTLEGGFAFLPYINNENREVLPPDTETFELDDETWGLRFSSNLLYHLNSNAAATFDPFVGLTGGLAYYGDDLENNQQWDPYGGLAAGMTFWVSDGLGIRTDYNIVVAGHDSEFNQQLLLSLTYSWGRRAKAVEASRMGADDNLSSGVANPNLKTIYFPFDSSMLTDTAKGTLKANADYLSKNPGTKIVLEGHCDERGTDEYNLALGERRARSAFEYLRSLGITRDRMSTVSYGESRPAAMGHNEAAWSMNRRVECVELNN